MLRPRNARRDYARVFRRTVCGESHAWAEWWTGDWFGFDPTNDHVVVARAREYSDVPPLSGVFGGSASNLEVQVMVTLLA